MLLLVSAATQLCEQEQYVRDPDIVHINDNDTHYVKAIILRSAHVISFFNSTATNIISHDSAHISGTRVHTIPV